MFPAGVNLKAKETLWVDLAAVVVSNNMSVTGEPHQVPPASNLKAKENAMGY